MKDMKDMKDKKYWWQLFTEITLTCIAGYALFNSKFEVTILIFIWIEVRHIIYIKTNQLLTVNKHD
jgi:hypothetical protein